MMTKTAPKTSAAAPAVKGSQIGVVESDTCSQTRKVVVSFLAKHPKYGKFIRRRTVLHVHDQDNTSRVGDRVEVAPCRPMSKTKFFRLVRVIESAPRVTA